MDRAGNNDGGFPHKVADAGSNPGDEQQHKCGTLYYQIIGLAKQIDDLEGKLSSAWTAVQSARTRFKILRRDLTAKRKEYDELCLVLECEMPSRKVGGETTYKLAGEQGAE